ncbi:hypothetical protein AbraIFM66951_005600 [Aspergillus brasiliensis]|nr:hypothetical protein AbraIFM66951_005600 [Aspergillus brasiliensis]
MSRRMWWSLYILDRRVAIETGHPFLIQNINVDTPLPRPLDDDQLSRFRNCPEVDLETLQPSETGGPYTTSFPYFRAMIAYSQLLGKVWEGLYGAASLDLAPNHSLREHLERLLFRAQKDIHPEFAHPHYGPRAAQFVETPWWLMKQQAIIEEVSRFPEEKVIFTFPFLHYLIGATITSLGLIMKENTFKAAYGGATIYAVRLLESYCAKTWVSGKLIRVVSRLRHMASRLLRDGDIVGSGLPLYKHSSQAFPGIQDARAREAEVGRSEIPSMAHSCPEPSSPSAGERELIGPPDMNIRPGVACESISQMPPLHGRDTTEPYLPTQALSFDGLGSLVMSDFDFEEGVPGGSRFGTLPPGDASIQPLPNDQPEGGAGTSHTRPLTMHNDLAAGEPVAPYNIRNSGDSGMEEMEWLEALFGNYVNSDFIPRQYT